MSNIDKEACLRVFEALGPERVECGMMAFWHEPERTFCNCFATDCFAEELRWPRTQEGRREAYVNLKEPVFKDNGARLAADIERRLGITDEDSVGVFEEAYEFHPEELAPLAAEWLTQKQGG